MEEQRQDEQPQDEVKSDDQVEDIQPDDDDSAEVKGGGSATTPIVSRPMKF